MEQCASFLYEFEGRDCALAWMESHVPSLEDSVAH